MGGKIEKKIFRVIFRGQNVIKVGKMPVFGRPLKVSVSKTQALLFLKAHNRYINYIFLKLSTSTNKKTRKRESILCQKKYFLGHLVECSLGRICFENAKFD